MPRQIANTGQLLVVSPLPQDDLATLLRSDGHAVLICGDTSQALALAEAQAPDLILLDLPGQAGSDLLALLHAHPVLQPIPVIVLTAAPDAQRLLRAFGAGAVDYIAKPCAPAELLARLQVHLRLKLTRDRLEQVARERQALLNLVAHDLKNPLTSVLFACEMLALPDCRPDRVPRYLQIVDESTREALGYIRRYLENQTRPTPAEPVPGPSCTHLGDTLRWLSARYQLQFEACGLHLQVQSPAQEACVTIDGQALRQVSENLVSNALKYARSGGELTLEARPGPPGTWQLLAKDRGPGVPAGFQPRLFEPFQRLQGDDPDAAQSSGLGLALARQIVVEAGGRLWYEDREGGGACFLLELPQSTCSGHCD